MSSVPTPAEKLETGSIASLPDVIHEEDAMEAKRVIRKIDWRLLPLLTLLYTLTFLDRVNIGNARLWNLEKDLNMHGYQYNIIVLIFYIPYILLEIPSNMVINRVQPRYWISFLAMGWGLTITFSGFCTSFGGLLTARIFLGIFEAGMFPGCLFLIGAWYRRHELVTRTAWFMVSNDIAGTISGLLGAGLGSLNGATGYSGWCWIFFIEGAMTCCAAVLAFFFLVPFPEDADFLTAEEKRWVLNRLQAERFQESRDAEEHITLKSVLSALTDWKVLISGVFYLAVCVTAYSISVFQPTILKVFGWSDLKSNLLTAPVRIASGIVSVCVGILSDKVKRRAPFVIGGFSISIMGNLLVMLLKNGNLRYMGMYFAAIGIYICQPLVIAWGVNQVASNSKRGILTGFAVSCGQIGGIISAVVFPTSDSSQYIPGISTCIAFAAVGIISAVAMWFFCGWENRQRDMGKRDHLRQLPQEEQDKLGERHPDFRYVL